MALLRAAVREAVVVVATANLIVAAAFREAATALPIGIGLSFIEVQV